MQNRYYGYKDKAYGVTVDGHEIHIVFDKKLLVLNRIRLVVDGEEVDREQVFYGDKQLEHTLPDGTPVVVSIDSGMVGELTRAQLKRPDGTWIDLQELPTADG